MVVDLDLLYLYVASVMSSASALTSFFALDTKDPYLCIIICVLVNQWMMDSVVSRWFCCNLTCCINLLLAVSYQIGSTAILKNRNIYKCIFHVCPVKFATKLR